MRRLLLVLLISLGPVVALGGDRPDWAFPAADKVQPPSKEDDRPKMLAGSSGSYTPKADRRSEKSAGLVSGHAFADAGRSARDCDFCMRILPPPDWHRS
jgi:hypothetical protein